MAPCCHLSSTGHHWGYKKRKERREKGWPFGSPKREGKTGFSFSFWNWKRNGSGQRKVGRERVGRKGEREEKKVFASFWLIVGLCKKGGILFRQLEVKKRS